MIGLLSLSNAENYGAVLQSMALCEFMNSHQIDAEIIDFTPDFIVGRYKMFFFSRNSVSSFVISFLNSIRLFPLVFLKRMRFYFFRKKNLQFSKKRYIRQIANDCYDKYIVGSDQVWNLELTNYEELFFLPFTDKKYSYAASIGVSQLTDRMSTIINKYLPGFKKISVREKTAVDLLSSVCEGLVIEKHIDPTFLLEAEKWASYAVKRLIEEKYVLIYTFDRFSDALKIARQTGYKIYSIHNSYRGTIGDVRSVPGVGPSEFLSLIMYADYVVTDSFHGMAFSIIFNKKFTVLPYRGTEARMVDLLEEFNLTSRIYSENSNWDDEIDYERINAQIVSERKKSLNYLRSVARE